MANVHYCLKKVLWHLLQQAGYISCELLLFRWWSHFVIIFQSVSKSAPIKAYSAYSAQMVLFILYIHFFLNILSLKKIMLILHRIYLVTPDIYIWRTSHWIQNLYYSLLEYEKKDQEFPVLSNYWAFCQIRSAFYWVNSIILTHSNDENILEPPLSQFKAIGRFANPGEGA